jgi:NAD(P)-dependent dehydrogenase (short-subunit alcohol dehydrogenase family)|uniref:SDR family NAD(P)-dependent oxidoreductase n=1 Tax=Cephaloticoccus sp. TaxID=1985742 RepID=UPI00404B6B3F
MAIDLTGKVCLITGADEGIGQGVLQGFLKRGAKVAGGLLNPDKFAARCAPAFTVAMDVTKPEQIEAAVAQVVAHFGRIDVLVNNAGIYPRCPADEMTYADFEKVRQVNLDGTWRCCLAVIPHFKKQGSGIIINTGSITLRAGLANLSHYESTKGAIVGITRGLARDLGKFGVRVNCLHLGAVKTEGELRLGSNQEALIKTLEDKQSLSGRLTPETVEPSFAFFASNESGDITGQCLTVDRGWVHE